MKKKIAIVSCVIAISTAYLVACPYLAVNRIRDGLVNKDSEALSENIEFPTLKQHLKDQMNAGMAKSMEKDDENPGMQLFAQGLATLFIDKAIDHYITSGGLTRVLRDGEMSDDNASDASDPGDPSELFDKARYSFDSLNSFSVYIPSEDDAGEVRLVLKRRGLTTWKLCYLYFPEGAFDRDKPQDDG